jgi:hypothetical protein
MVARVISVRFRARHLFFVSQLQDFSEDEDPEEESARNRAMLADIGTTAVRPKRKRHDFVVTEALPESEMNLNPSAASEGVLALQHCTLPRTVQLSFRRS